MILGGKEEAKKAFIEFVGKGLSTALAVDWSRI